MTKPTEATIARLTFYLPPERWEEFAQVYPSRLAPMLPRHGLVEIAPPPRKVPHAFSRLFEVESPASVARVRKGLEQDGQWREAMTQLGARFSPEPAVQRRLEAFGFTGILTFQGYLEVYSAPAGPGRSTKAGPGRSKPLPPARGHWRTYDATDGLGSGVVRGIVQDRQGTLWVAVFGGGLNRFDGDRFESLGIRDGLPTNKVQGIALDREGALWLPTHGSGVCRYDGRRFETFTTADGLAHDTVVYVFRDGDGNLWFATWGGGVSRYDGRRFETFGTRQGLVHDQVQAIGQDRDGNLWFATWNGACRYDGRRFEPVTAADGLPSDRVWSVCAGDDGVMWFGTEAGLSRYDGAGFHNFDTDDGLAGNDVWALLPDGRGNLWIGTKGGGVSRYDGKGFVSFATAEGLAVNWVESIAQDNEGALWFGTWTGLSRYEVETFATLPLGSGRASLARGRGDEVWLHDGEGLHGLSGSQVTTFSGSDGLPQISGTHGHRVFVDAAGDVWLAWPTALAEGTWGVVRFDGERFTHYGAEDGLVGDKVSDICQDRSGALWFGTSEGVSRYDGERFTTLSMADGLLDNQAVTVFADGRGTLWIGAFLGLSRYDGREVRTFTRAEGLTDDWVRAIGEDSSGAVWIGTNGGGVSRCEGEGFVTFDRAAGLADNNVPALLCDRTGVLWFGTHGGGVSRYDGEVFQSLTEEDGLAANYVPSMVEDGEGNLWFATTAGLTRYHRPLPAPLPVFVDAVVADRRHGAPTELTMPDSVGLTSFEFHAVSYRTRPEAMVYQYRLAGLETEWHAVRQRRAEYHELPQGAYEFQVRAVDRDLYYSRPASVRLTVVPDPRDQRIDELEQRVRERTLELEARNREMAAANRRLAVEAAVERVRATALGMRDSRDLGQAAAAVFHELAGLGFSKLWRCWIAIVDEPSRSASIWSTAAQSGEAFLMDSRHPLAGRPYLEALFDAWKRGEDLHTDDLQGEELVDLVRYCMAAGLDLPEWRTRAPEDLPRRMLLYDALFPQGFLHVVNTQPLAEEDLRIVRRFRDAFALAYTRFLDLQDAERRAREAQIEAALERVRAKAMGMQKSEDLPEVAAVLFGELRSLEFPVWRCGIIAVDQEAESATFWYTTAQGEAVGGMALQLQGHPVNKSAFAAWKRREVPWMSVDLSGEPLRDFIHFAVDQSGMLAPEWRSGTAPDRLILNCAFFPHGWLYVGSLEPVSEEHLETASRFAGAFGLAYTRFIDLQKAEARVRQSARQAAVDRVRAEIATMRASADLERVTPLIWKELTDLGVEFSRCAVFLVDEERGRARAYLANPRGEPLAALDLAFDSHPTVSAIVAHWRSGTAYRFQWDREEMLEWVRFLQAQGQVAEPPRIVIDPGKSLPSDRSSAARRSVLSDRESADPVTALLNHDDCSFFEIVSYRRQDGMEPVNLVACPCVAEAIHDDADDLAG